MSTKAQVIFDKGKPAFVVLAYKDYVRLTGEHPEPRERDAEFVPFVLSEYIKNPIRLKRVEAGLSQEQFAKLLGVTQGYVSKIESRNYAVSDALLNRVTGAIASTLSKRRKKKA